VLATGRRSDERSLVMKVILMQKVERLGEAGQHVEVADGYARNFLLPRQLAVIATPGRVRSLALLAGQVKNREERIKREAAALGERMAEAQITFQRRASEEAPVEPAVAPAGSPAEATPAVEGAAVPVEPEQPVAPRLFGSVTGQDIAEALTAMGFAVDKRQVVMKEPIKTLGVHAVPVRLHADVTATVSVTVEPED
jgi:large subunit ribosomal protein L9